MTDSSLETKNKLISDFNDKIYHSHGKKTISCGILIAIYANLNICVKNKVNDNDSRVLIVEITINGFGYLRINLYIMPILKENS